MSFYNRIRLIAIRWNCRSLEGEQKLLGTACPARFGTYSVNPDCTGTQTIVIPGNPDVHVQFIVAQSGNTIHQVVIDPGVAATAEGERVRAPKSKD